MGQGERLRLLQLDRSRVVGVAVCVYLALVLVVSFHFNISLSPDRIILLLVVAALATGRFGQFLKDWSIFLVVLLAWQLLTGFSHQIGHLPVHKTEMIVVDRAIFFGHVPTVWLQHHLYHPGHLAWYDVVATTFYLLHFVFPMAVAFALWIWKRPVFLEFMMAFLCLALAGFATFVLFPAAPPWLAADWHYLPHVYRILHPGIAFFGGNESLSALYTWMWRHGGWDAVAAVPSEHAAFPFLCFLYARRAWPRAGWTLLPYCCAVWISVVYLGEHYATDIIVGVVYASVVYSATRYVASRRSPRPSRDELDQTAAATVSDRLPA
jgi:hypothetical protein